MERVVGLDIDKVELEIQKGKTLLRGKEWKFKNLYYKDSGLVEK